MRSTIDASVKAVAGGAEARHLHASDLLTITGMGEIASDRIRKQPLRSARRLCTAPCRSQSQCFPTAAKIFGGNTFKTTALRD